MQLVTVAKKSELPILDVVVVPFFQGKDKAEPACSVTDFDKETLLPVSLGDFKGKEGESLLLYRSGKEKRVLLLGLGKKKGCTADQMRRAYGSAVRHLRAKKILKISVIMPEVGLACPIFEGIKLANYRYDQLKKHK